MLVFMREHASATCFMTNIIERRGCAVYLKSKFKEKDDFVLLFRHLLLDFLYSCMVVLSPAPLPSATVGLFQLKTT